jgi:hypothetical protein
MQYHQAVSNPASSKPSNRSAVRFAVGRPEGPRGAVWRLWTHKNEVYLGAWSVAPDMKISIHSSGEWRHAFTSEHVAKGSPFLAPGQDRTTDRWKRPREFLPGTTKAFMIVVPSSEVTMPRHPEAKAAFRRKLGKKAVVWVPAAPEGHATHFSILLTKPEATVAALRSWPGPKAATRFVWRKELPNGQCVWIISRDWPNIVQRWVPPASANLQKLTMLRNRGWNRGECITGVIA